MSFDMRNVLGALTIAALAAVTMPAWAGEAAKAPPAEPAKTAPAEAAKDAPKDAPKDDAKKPQGAAIGVGSGWAAEVAPPGSKCLTLDETQAATLKQVSDYFNNLGSVKGAFVQTGADAKRMKGKFYMKRPGKFRFDYALPSKQLIVSDGEYLAIQDLDLNNEDRVEVNQTPFRLLLKKDVDLSRDACINEVQSAEDLIVVALQDKSPDTPGVIRLFLAAKPAVELKEWVTTDAQGQLTKVEVSELDRSEELKAELFKIQSVGPNKMQQ